MAPVASSYGCTATGSRQRSTAALRPPVALVAVTKSANPLVDSRPPHIPARCICLLRQQANRIRAALSPCSSTPYVRNWTPASRDPSVLSANGLAWLTQRNDHRRSPDQHRVACPATAATHAGRSAKPHPTGPRRGRAAASRGRKSFAWNNMHTGRAAAPPHSQAVNQKGSRFGPQKTGSPARTRTPLARVLQVETQRLASAAS